MAGGVDVNIGADTRDFERSVKSGMQEPVQDAQKALDDYVAAGGEAGDKLTGVFTDQQRQTTELKDDIDRLNRTIRDGSSSSYRSAGTDVDTFRKHSTEGFDEIKDSARSNAIEVGASFTGGFDQALGGLQGFVAEFLAGFGPAGIIAGVGAAALLGLVTQAITDGQEAADAQKQAIADLAGEYIDAGASGRRSFDSVTESIKAMATSDGSDVVITLQRAFEAAKLAGADYEGVVKAIASGSPAEIGRARRAVDELASSHAHVADTSRTAVRGIVADNQRQLRANQELGSALDKAAGQARDAERAQKLAARAGLSDLSLKRDLLHQLEGAYDDAAGSVDDYIGKESHTLNVAKYLEAMRKRTKALADYNEEITKANLSPAAIKFLESKGADQAAAMLRGYQNASPKQKAELNKIWTTAGTENASTYRDAVGKDLAKPIDAPKIKPPRVPLPDDQALKAYLNTPKVYRVVLEGVTRSGQRVF